MGLFVRTNDKGEFQLESTVTDSLIHEKEWLTRDEAVFMLIERQAWRFIESVVETYMDFPDGYKEHYMKTHNNPDKKFWKWLSDYDYDVRNKNIHKKYLEICDKLNFTFQLEDE